MRFLARVKPRDAVCHTGAKAGCVLTGTVERNSGLRLRILEDQPQGPGGPIVGVFHILDVGDNKYSARLEALVGQATTADQVVRLIRQASPQCVNIVNSNMLVLEPPRCLRPGRGETNDAAFSEEPMMNSPGEVPARFRQFFFVNAGGPARKIVSREVVARKWQLVTLDCGHRVLLGKHQKAGKLGCGFCGGLEPIAEPPA